jgi:serine/threonine-protein kinase HipA
MNLPEGYLLQVLQEQFGPHIGADPLALLSVIGRNMVGRVQVAAAGADLEQAAQAVEVRELLQGDNSEEAFAELVRCPSSSIRRRSGPATLSRTRRLPFWWADIF